MDLQQVVSSALLGTLSASADDRKQAEGVLKQCQTVPQFAVMLIKLMTAAEVPPPLRQSAAVQFKSLIVARWTTKPDRPGLSAEDKELVKENMVELIINVPAFVRVQVAVAFKSVLEKEFPHNWNSLLGKIVHYLQVSDPSIVHGALHALYLICQKYSSKPTEAGLREPLYAVIDATFGPVLTIFQSAVQHNTLPAIELQKLICKIFWACTQLVVPPSLISQGALTPWFTAMLELYSREVPQNAGEPQEPSERVNWLPWKLKKWIGHTFNRFIQRYSKPRSNDAPPVQQFATYFAQAYAPQLLQANLVLLGHVAAGQYRPPRLIAIALGSIGEAVRFGAMYQPLKPHIAGVLCGVVVPLFFYNDQDQQLWDEDPAEYLRKDGEIVDDFWDPRLTGVNLICDLIKLRGELHLHTVAMYCLGILKQYSETEVSQRNVRAKDGALTVLGNLCVQLSEAAQFKDALEQMIVNHVFTEFTSPHPFLRSRACWIFGQFYEVYKNQETFIVGLRAVLQCMADPELPVRVKAALSLRMLCLSAFSTQALREILPQLLEALLNMMREVENEDLLKTLQVIIEKYSDEISPFAAAMTQRLVDYFLRLVDNDDDDENSAMTAMECLGAIQTILDATSKVGDTWGVYSQLEPIVLPALVKVMDQDGMDFFDEGIKILSFFTFYGETISDTMWSLFPLIYNAFMNWAPDWMDELIIPLDNYISRGTAKFLSHPDYLNMILAMYEKLVGEKGISEVDAGHGAKLIEVVLHSCKGALDEKLPNILRLALQRLLHPETGKDSLRVLLLEVVANSLYYNPLLTLQTLEQASCTLPVFELWFQHVPNFKRAHDKKVSVLGLTSILLVPFGSLPPSIQGALPHLMRLLLRFAHLAREQREKEDAEDDGSDVDSEQGGYGSEDDTDTPAQDDEDVDLDAATLHRLAAEAAQEYSWTPGEDDDLQEEGLYISAIDEVDEILFFVNHFKAFSDQHPTTTQGIVTLFTAEEKEQLQALVVFLQNKAAASAQSS